MLASISILLFSFHYHSLFLPCFPCSRITPNPKNIPLKAAPLSRGRGVGGEGKKGFGKQIWYESAAIASQYSLLAYKKKTRR
jgi:hypothetical protein